jgi:hypothetical protein
MKKIKDGCDFNMAWMHCWCSAGFYGTRIGLDGVGGMFSDRIIPMCEICSGRRI